MATASLPIEMSARGRSRPVRRVKPPDWRTTPGTFTAAAVAILAIARSLMTKEPRRPGSSAALGSDGSATATASEDRAEVEMSVAVCSDRHTGGAEQDCEDETAEPTHDSGECEEQTDQQSDVWCCSCQFPSRMFGAMSVTVAGSVTAFSESTGRYPAVDRSPTVTFTGTSTNLATTARTRSATLRTSAG